LYKSQAGIMASLLWYFFNRIIGAKPNQASHPLLANAENAAITHLCTSWTSRFTQFSLTLVIVLSLSIVATFNIPVLAQQGGGPVTPPAETPTPPADSEAQATPQAQPEVEETPTAADEAADLPVGDVNKDRRVDILDLTYIANRYGSNDLSADVNGDGQVNIFDLVAAAKNYGQQGR
jgi:hypothetical protein